MEDEISFFVARVIMLIYLPVGVAMLTGQLKAKEMFSSFRNSAGLTVFVGVFGLIAGAFLVHYHNIWVKDWPVLITLLGWVAVIECMALIAFPKTMLSMGDTFSRNEKFWGFAAILFALLFGYFGFVA